MAAAKLGIEEGQRLHAKYANEDTYYPARVVAVSSAKNRAKKPVKITYDGYPEEVWVSIDVLKSKKLGLKPKEAAPEPKAKAKAKAKGKPAKGEKAAPEPKAKAKAKAKVKAKAKAKAADGEEKKKRDPVKFMYFGLWAKGPAIALALEHSGIDWVGEFPQDWKESVKPTTPWLELPVLEIPGVGTIGHETAILNYVGRRIKKMDGFTMPDYLISQQLMQEAEDIYKRLGAIKQGALSEAEVADFWDKEDPTSHNRSFGIKVYLGLIDKFYTKCNAGDGKFTKSGITVGECKLFTMLHACKMCRGDCLDAFAGVKAFYDRFAALEKTQAVLAGTGKMPGEFKQYFGV